MVPKSCFSRSGPPPGALRGPNPFSRDPPGAPKAHLGAPRAARNPPKRAQEPPRARSNLQSRYVKTLVNMCIWRPGISTKTLSDHFSRLRVPPRDPPVWRPYSSRSTPGPQKGPRGLPGTPQEPLRAPPGPPRAPLKILSWHIFFLKSWVFSFYTFFHLILTFLQSVSLFVNVPLSAFTHISNVF